tara:strand:- start:13258 stop:13452 length:195 start_codon:yes stop_codon:yes gene_type:complete
MKNLKQWKTTTLGLILMIAAGADLWHFEKLSEMALGAVLVIGILFLFSPDKALKFLDRKTGGDE